MTAKEIFRNVLSLIVHLAVWSGVSIFLSMIFEQWIKTSSVSTVFGIMSAMVLVVFILWSRSDKDRRTAFEIVVGFLIAQLVAHSMGAGWLFTQWFSPNKSWIQPYETMMVSLVVVALFIGVTYLLRVRKPAATP